MHLTVDHMAFVEIRNMSRLSCKLVFAGRISYCKYPWVTSKSVWWYTQAPKQQRWYPSHLALYYYLILVKCCFQFIYWKWNFMHVCIDLIFSKSFLFWVSLNFSYITTRKCAVNNCKLVHVVKLSYSISSVLNFRTNFFAFVYEFTNRANLLLIENVERFVETRMVTWCVQMWAIWYFYHQF